MQKPYSNMRILSIFLFLACAHPVWAQKPAHPYKGVKQMSALVKNKGDKEFALEYEVFFDKKGNQTKHLQPTFYCTQEWTYNDQDLVIKYYVMCGESFGNGETVYEYLPNITKSVQTTGAFERVVIDSLDAKKNIVSRTTSMKVEGDFYEPAPTDNERITYSYNAKNQLIKEYADARKELTAYFYRGDSLQTILRTLAGRQDTLLQYDFYRDSGRKAWKRYPVASGEKSGYYFEKYQYDEKGRVLVITKSSTNEDGCNATTPCVIEKTEYIYKGDMLFEVKTSYYKDDKMTGYEAKKYAKGLPLEIKTFDAQNALQSHTIFKIQRW